VANLRPGEPGGQRHPKIAAGVRHAPRLRDELEWCARHGIPRSVFLGRELTSRTTYLYDRPGRLAETVTVTESPWTDEDRQLALEWQAEQRLRCPGCGQPRDESVGKHADEAYEATARTCHGCAALDQAQTKAEQDKVERAGLHYELHRIRPPSADRAAVGLDDQGVSGG
jgi:hypothetical protein